MIGICVVKSGCLKKDRGFFRFWHLFAKGVKQGGFLAFLAKKGFLGDVANLRCRTYVGRGVFERVSCLGVGVKVLQGAF